MANASKQKLLLLIASSSLSARTHAHIRSSLRGNTDVIHDSPRDLSTRRRRLPQKAKQNDLAKLKRINDERKRKNEQQKENEWKGLTKEEKKKLLAELKIEEEDVAEHLGAKEQNKSQDEQLSNRQQYATLITTSLADIDTDTDQDLNKLWKTLTKDEKKQLIALEEGKSIIDKKTGEVVDNPAYVVEKLDKKEKKEQIKLQMAQNSEQAGSEADATKPTVIVEKLDKKEKKEQIKLQMAQNSEQTSSEADATNPTGSGNNSEQVTSMIVKPGEKKDKDDNVMTQNSEQGNNNAGNFVIPMPELTFNEDNVDILVLTTTTFSVDDSEDTKNEAENFVIPKSDESGTGKNNEGYDFAIPESTESNGDNENISKDNSKDENDTTQNSEQTTNSVNSNEANNFAIPVNLYYPMENRCINDGNQPDYLASEEMFDTIEACCEHHYDWSTDCVTGGSESDTVTTATDTTAVTPETIDTTGWYYPNEGFCYNTGTPPIHINDADMFETLEACCEHHYLWSNECLEAPASNNNPVNVSTSTTGIAVWYPYEGFCYNDGKQASHIKEADMFDTLEACCEHHYSWSSECLEEPVSSNSNTAVTTTPEIHEEPKEGEFTFTSKLVDPSVQFDSTNLKWAMSGHGWSMLDSSGCVQSGITNEIIGKSVSAEPVYSNLTLTTEKDFEGGVLTFQLYQDDGMSMPNEVFYIAVDGETSFSRVSLGNDDWVEYSVSVSRGEHTVTWSHVYNPLALEALPERQGEPSLRIDDLRFTPFMRITDQGFEDNKGNGLVMTSDGNAVWRLDNGSSNSGSYSIIAKTSEISQGSGSSNVNFVLFSEYGGNLKYKISTSTTAPHDDFAILLNDRPVDAVVGSMPSWEYRSLDIPMGKAVVTLQHRKNPGNLSNEVLEALGKVSTEGLTRLDDIRFEPRYNS